jgi:hypothetical protein
MSNIKLECYANRVKGKIGYSIEKDGRVLHDEIAPYNSDSMKRCILEAVHRGLKAVRPFVAHEDVLTVVVQNQHVACWVLDRDEKKYKEYVDQLDSIFDRIDELDCRYKVVCIKKFAFMGKVDKGTVTGLKLEGLSSLENWED